LIRKTVQIGNKVNSHRGTQGNGTGDKSQKIKRLIRDMVEHHAPRQNLIGIAAPQIGVGLNRFWLPEVRKTRGQDER